MNLAAYDIIKSKKDMKNWVDIKAKRLNSVEIPFYTYYYIVRRYDPYYKIYTYYIVLTNERFDDPTPRCAYSPRKGLVRIDLRDIWNKSNLCKLKSDSEITIKITDKQEDCVIYKLDI